MKVELTKNKKSKAKERLQKAIDAIPELKKLPSSTAEFKKWRRNTEVAISNTFSENSRHVKDFTNIRYSLMMASDATPDSAWQKAYVEGLETASSVLESMIEEIEEYWDNDEVNKNEEVLKKLIATYSHINLLPEQEELFCQIVEIALSTPREQRGKFLIASSRNGDTIIAPTGLNFNGHLVDIEELNAQDLLRMSFGLQGTPNFSVTAEGYKYYEYLKKKSGQPVERIEKEVRSLINSNSFLDNYSEAYNKWAEAENKLWSIDESKKALTTIGHLCREAIQFFTAFLVDKYEVTEADPDKTHTVARLQVVLHKVCQSKTDNAFLNALVAYWGTVSDLIQRLEHGAQKESQALNWEDARRVVFQTAIVMFEIDKTLKN